MSKKAMYTIISHYHGYTGEYVPELSEYVEGSDSTCTT